MREYSIFIPIVNDSIPEDDELFSASLTLHPDNQTMLGSVVTVSPNATTVTIQDEDCKYHFLYCILLGKRSWALAVQAPKIKGGRLHEGDA